MKYNLIKMILSILDIFYNPVGITASLIALLIGILMCIYGKIKSRIICVFSLLALSILSIVICVVGNSPDYLILPLFIIPFFAIMSFVFLIHAFINLLLKIKCKR